MVTSSGHGAGHGEGWINISTSLTPKKQKNKMK